MSNTWVNPTIVAKETLRQLKNNTVMGQLVYRDMEQEWQKTHNSWKPGQSVTIKAPLYLRVKDSATLDVVNVVERSLTMTLSYRKHVAVAVTSDEMTYNVDKGLPRVAKAAAQALGEYIDTQLLGQYKYIANQVGTPGQTPKDFLTLALANAKLSDHACPASDRHCVINPTATAYISDALKSLYNPSYTGPLVEQARIGRTAGMTIYESQNVNSHTCGTAAGLTTPLVYGTVSEGATTIPVDTNGSWTLTMLAGDLFTIENVYGVNPITGVSTGQLRQFCCDQNALDNGTDGTIYCTPGTSPNQIYSASAAEDYLPYQTVDALPADNAKISVVGTAGQVYPVNLAFHRDCIALAMVPLAMPDSVVWKAQENYEGYSIRVLRDYDVVNDQEYLRFDVLFAIKVINPFLGCRIAG